MIGDPQLKVAKAYDMLPEGAGETSEGRTAADNATVRSVFIIGPDKKVKAMLTYPMSSGRNFDEVLRLLDSMPAHGEASGRHARQLEAWRGCDHRPDLVPTSRRRRNIPMAGNRRSPICGSSRSRTDRRHIAERRTAAPARRRGFVSPKRAA